MKITTSIILTLNSDKFTDYSLYVNCCMVKQLNDWSPMIKYKWFGFFCIVEVVR